MTKRKKVWARHPRCSTQRLFNNDCGSVAIETGLGAIVFVTLLTGVISFGSLFFVQGNMSDAARDAARRIATGELTPAEAETHAEDALVNWGQNYVVVASNDGTDAMVEISVPMMEVAIIDFLGLLSGDLRAQVTLPTEL